MQSGFDYFMGARQAYVDAGGQPASVSFRAMNFASNYVLSGDANYPIPATDADPVNYNYDTLFDPKYSPAPIHNARVNVLFGDLHAQSYHSFKPGDMTFSYYLQGIAW
jgi:prepilin-type processing-associated H-X9-DG protein